MIKNRIVFLTPRKLLLFILTFTAGVYFSGCTNSITSTGTVSPRKNQARTEQEFSFNSNLKADAGAVIAVNLEGLNSPVAEIGDTGPIGEDIIPYIYTETAQHRFTIDDTSDVKIKLVSDATGLTIAEVNPGNSLYVNIPAGSYKMHLISLFNYTAEEPSSIVFVQTNTRTPYAGTGTTGTNYTIPDVDKFIQQHGCSKCDMSGADFSGMSLHGIRVGEGIFNSAKFVKTKVRSSLMIKCKFDSTNFNGMVPDAEGGGFNFSECTFSNAKLANIVRGTNLEFTRSTFDNCDFNGTSFYRPHIENVTFSNSNFSGSSFFYPNLAASTFYKSNLQRFKLSGDGRNLTFDNVNAKHMIFDDSNILNSHFRYSNFDSVKVAGSFCGSDRRNTEFRFYFGSARCFPMPDEYP